MKLNNEVLDSVFITSKCAFCNTVFYTKSLSARYCCISHKKLFFKEKRKNQRWYDVDPNKGKTFPLGTITSWSIPEDKLVFSGDLESLYHKISEFISPEQFSEKKEWILKLKPYSETGKWGDSSVQIFTDDNFMEVFWISREVYKFYVWKWDNENERPF